MVECSVENICCVYVTTLLHHANKQVRSVRCALQHGLRAAHCQVTNGADLGVCYAATSMADTPSASSSALAPSTFAIQSSTCCFMPAIS